MSLEREEILTELLSYARFERASFSVLCDAGCPLPKSEDEVDAFVKERTRLYMDTWVIPKIEQLLEHERQSTPAGKQRARLLQLKAQREQIEQEVKAVEDELRKPENKAR